MSNLNSWPIWLFIHIWGCRGRMVCGFTTNYAVSDYHHWSC